MDRDGSPVAGGDRGRPLLAETGPRITVPVDADRTPHATIQLAATIARQADLTVEFAALAGRRPTLEAEADLLRRCVAAEDAGAPRTSSVVLDAGRTIADVAAYASWSGSQLICLGTRSHTLGYAVEVLPRATWLPVLVLGPHANVQSRGYRRLVVGVETPRDVTHRGEGPLWSHGLSSAATSGNLDNHPADLADDDHDHVVDEASQFAGCIGAELEMIEVLTPDEPPRERCDVPDTAHLRRVARTLEPPPTTFDTIHDRHPAEAIVRFVGHDEQAIIVVGMHPVRRSARWLGGSGRRAVVRRANCPVLIVPPAPSYEASLRPRRVA